MKLGKRSLIDKVEADIPTGEEAKVQKQANKNLNKTMNTNFMDINIPLSMKYRNYKSTRPKVTIGPSAIHRNGLFATVK